MNNEEIEEEYTEETFLQSILKHKGKILIGTALIGLATSPFIATFVYRQYKSRQENINNVNSNNNSVNSNNNNNNEVPESAIKDAEFSRVVFVIYMIASIVIPIFLLYLII